MERNTSIGAIAGVAIVLVIAFVFALFPAESDDTIVLVNKQGTDPINSCAPGNGLILAQNLTDLCDVFIVSPTTNQIIRYNGSFWVNVNQSSSVTSITSNNNNTIGVVPTTGNVVLYPKYQLLCQKTLVSDNTTISCNNFSAHKNLIIEGDFKAINGTGIVPAIRFNGDSGNNYSNRYSFNGGADTTSVNTSFCNSGVLLGSGNSMQLDMNMYNQLADRKTGTGLDVSGSGSSAGTAPSRVNFSCKWDNTSSQITSITMVSGGGTGVYGTNSQITIWGYN